jgi:hypothetical protein
MVLQPKFYQQTLLFTVNVGLESSGTAATTFILLEMISLIVYCLILLSIDCFVSLIDASSVAKQFFIDGSLGDDSNNGTTPATAWKSLRRIQQIFDLAHNYTFDAKIDVQVTPLRYSGADNCNQRFELRTTKTSLDFVIRPTNNSVGSIVVECGLVDITNNPLAAQAVHVFDFSVFHSLLPVPPPLGFKLVNFEYRNNVRLLLLLLLVLFILMLIII